MSRERRKRKVRRKLVNILPILALYARRRNPLEPKQIARRLHLSHGSVTRALRAILRAL